MSDKHYFKCLIYRSSLNSYYNLNGNDNCGDKIMLSINKMLKDSAVNLPHAGCDFSQRFTLQGRVKIYPAVKIF